MVRPWWLVSLRLEFFEFLAALRYRSYSRTTRYGTSVILYNLSHNFGIIWFLWYFKNKHFGLCFAAPEVRTPKLRHLNCNVSVYITLIQEILWNLNHEDWVCFEIVEMSYAIHQFTPFVMKPDFEGRFSKYCSIFLLS